MDQDRRQSLVLILFAHPALQKSRVNRVLIQGVQDLDGVTFHDLYEAYPDMDIDVKREQALLERHDVVVFMHPFLWYSTPAVLKEWQDLVLEHGWAYGLEGAALRDKRLLSAVTTGGPEEAYLHGSHNQYTMRELLVPIEQTANLCGMEYLPPFVVHGTHLMEDDEIRRHAMDFERTVVALRDGRLDLEAARRLPRLNTDLDAITTGEHREDEHAR
jgi:glutathione-regulated potassium-efflux system ancillary protein KefG